jgi:phosphatidylinositol N-acetylglucosaminyltransferase subunit P
MNNVEVYGFVFWVASCLATCVWLFWAICPESILRENLGLWFVPDKWWAVALPTHFVVAAVTGNFIYLGMVLLTTQPLDSRNLISDNSTPVHNDKDTVHDIADAHDIPLRTVNKLMFETGTPN